ncbi:DUF2141 domain-containing protein [Nonlabens antarcticus]|uniref:DUF2141 domain-containing protein n=1 Tax=Nonlabens antarcticus TaxID=392714 RepID=UPI001891C48B|nr:DUF2141 domain-containing protein [Nonlabens antarcticus]
MQTMITSILFVVVSAFAKAQSTPAPQTTYTLTITVENAQNDEGKMMFSLNTKEQFMRSKPFQSGSVDISDGLATFTFTGVPAGDYGVLVLQDKNDNGFMDYESNGMPKEPYGMSNNPTIYGPPTFQDARFSLSEDTVLKITI